MAKTQQLWTVYRDGGAWTVDAPDALKAVHYASEAFASPTFGRRKSTFEPGVGPQPGQERGPRTLVTLMLRGEVAFEVTKIDFGDAVDQSRVVFVDALPEPVSFTRVADAYDALRLQLKQLLRTPRRTPEVRRFKSGKKAGQLAFTKAHTDGDKACAVADHDFNDRLERAREQADLAADLTLSVMVWPRCTITEPANIGEAKALIARLEQIYVTCWLAGSTEVVRPWVRERSAELVRSARILDSLDRYGFAKGTACRSSYKGPATDGPQGVCMVTRVGCFADDDHWREVVDQTGRAWIVNAPTLMPA